MDEQNQSVLQKEWTLPTRDSVGNKVADLGSGKDDVQRSGEIDEDILHLARPRTRNIRRRVTPTYTTDCEDEEAIHTPYSA